MEAQAIPSFQGVKPSDRLRKSILLLFVAVFVALAATLTFTLLLHRHETLERGAERARNLASILNAHFSRTTGYIEATLNQLALLGSRAGGPHAATEVWIDALEAARRGIGGVAVLAVLDDKGTVTHATRPELVGRPRADTPLFQSLARHPASAILFTSPVHARATNEWIIPFGRRLEGADGQFAGAIVATLSPERLRDFYRSIDVGANGRIWLWRQDTGVLFAQPAHNEDSMGGIANFALTVASGGRGFMEGVLHGGDPLFAHAATHITAPPLVIGVSISQEDMLTEWRKDALFGLLALAAFTVFLILAWWLINNEFVARTRTEARIVTQAQQLAIAMTEREAAAAALRAKEAQFQSIMDHAPMMVSLKNLDGRFTFLNRAYVDFAGQSEDSILGHTTMELRGAAHAEKMEQQDRAVIQARRAMQWELTLDKAGGPRTVMTIKFPVYGDTGDINAVGAILVDVTEKKRAEAQIAQAERIEAIGQLSGGIAHDFNNLLTSILLNADVLASMLDDTLRPLAESVRTAAERGADLTRRLLAFGRRQMLEPRPTDVKELLTGMEPLMRRTLGEHIEIRSQHAVDLWSATVDPGQLENAVLNLAVNARDAMPGGGRLTLETSNIEVRPGESTDAEIKPGQYVTIGVADTGTGMSSDVIAHAFEPFFTTKDVGKGTGLGLSMVYGFVKQSGGHATIESEIGKGTRVRLFVPRSATIAATASPAPMGSADLPTGDETILFVEDDPMVRQHTGRQIVGLGYHVVAAENAVEALTLVEEGCIPDLLFTDIVMPGGINGHQLALRLRERWPTLRVLYTSGYAHDALTIDGEQVPNRYVLGKPYRRRDLAAKLRDVLDEEVG